MEGYAPFRGDLVKIKQPKKVKFSNIGLKMQEQITIMKAHARGMFSIGQPQRRKPINNKG